MRAFASLRRRGDFSRLRQSGRRLVTLSLTIYQGNQAGERCLVGISTGRKVGGAVVRNRVRRRVAAIVDDLAHREGLRGRFLIEARPAAATASFSRLREDLARAIGARR